jgi:hypothetical protein
MRLIYIASEVLTRVVSGSRPGHESMAGCA